MSSVVDTIAKFLANNEWFVAVVNITSLVGFIITLWVFVEIRRIRSHYVFKGRVPQHTKKLKRSASKIADYMNDFEDMLPQIKLELVSIEVELESLAKKLDRRSRQSINELLKRIRLCVGDRSKSISDLRGIYRDLHRVIARVEELQKDLNWEK